MVRYGSVCSGIEAATVAWHELGWKPVFFSEIEKFPSDLLAYYYPEVPNHGDMTKFEEWGYESGDIDVLVGGTPCQSFSIAGLRGGLGDDRGNLALTYMRMVDRLRPRWTVWENVPGVLSSSGGRDFGSIVGALAELGYSCAWRVLDAQNFGVPQRRRRVFLVGCSSRNWRDPTSVLFESGCGGRDFEACRQARQEDTSGFGVVFAASVAPAITSSGPPYSRTGNQRVECEALVVQSAVRRLTPVEAERLQGFPDWYTDFKKKTPDAPRYKALGNSMAVPVMRWIGERVDAVHKRSILS